LRILATSREPLGVEGEVVWRVPSLRVPGNGWDPDVSRLHDFESVHLFRDRARENLSTFQLSTRNHGSVARICRQLDGIPLAIELAAARVRALSVEQIADRLASRFDLLNASTRTAPPRQQTLQATIDWSYALLTQAEQSLFDRLAVFAGGWTLDAVEAISSGFGVSREDALDLLGRLVDKSMVLTESDDRGDIRYRMLETLRQFGQQRLAATATEAAVRNAHARFYQTLAQQADAELFGPPRQTLWLNRLELEHDNVRAALRWLLDQSDVQGALALAAGMRRFWLARSHHGEGQAWYAEILVRPGSEAPTLARAKALNGAGLAEWRHGNRAAAREFHLQARQLLSNLGDVTEEAWTLWRLGDIATELGDYAGARPLLNESLEKSRAAGSRAVEASALTYLALLELYEGDLAAARVHVDAALAIFQPLGFPRGKFFALHARAELSHGHADYGMAIRDLEQCLSLGQELRDPLLISEAYVNMGRAATLQDEYPRARGYLAQAVGLMRQLDGTWHIVRAIGAYALLAARQGKAARAVRLTAAIEAQGVISMRPPQRAECTRWIAPLMEALGSERAAAESKIGRDMQLDDVIAYALADDAADTAASDGGDDHLTRRETAVLRLLAGGYSNSEVAQELVLSVRTVERHVANIYSKIGAHGRAEATAYALRHGIAN
jgi:non-specific serine/threonine protein kinase